MSVFVWFVSLEHERINVCAASSSSVVTHPGLVLILPLAACGPQYRTPPLKRADCVSVYMCVWQWFQRFVNTSAVDMEWPLQWQWKADGMTKKNTDAEESWATHLLPPQGRYGSTHFEEQCYCAESKMVFGTHKRKYGEVYPELTGATNSGLPQTRQSPCSWPRKSPQESIAAPKLWVERKKEIYLKP